MCSLTSPFILVFCHLEERQKKGFMRFGSVIGQVRPAMSVAITESLFTVSTDVILCKSIKRLP